MKLWAISDLHLSHPHNRGALDALPAHPGDWLILAGDVCESPAVLDETLALLGRRFARLIWVPGNHELWTHNAPESGAVLSGHDKYRAMVAVARRHGALTPEDPWEVWPGPGPGPRLVIVPLMLLYDYSFRPPEVPLSEAVAWAMEEGILCADERRLNPAPHASIIDWCAQRCEDAARRLDALPPDAATILINHFPLRPDLVWIPRIPRFSPWCGTRRTEDWHRRFRAKVVVSGHLHVRRTDWRDGTRFEEVSLGYPTQWDHARGMGGYLREILPGASSDTG
jgi:predicted phosphodiesterase